MTYTENYFDEAVMTDRKPVLARPAPPAQAPTKEAAMAKQPLSDGSEEFFERFTPEEKIQANRQKNILLGLGITLGVMAGVGLALWLIKGRRKSWIKKLLD
ncbi:hypothetical protein HUU39_07310 [candidate division KSB1 bacterium]|nr:hypothetical protein [bacterium]NUM65072.1 hypothetical protein [candidate division KSB1 bacterium]